MNEFAEKFMSLAIKEALKCSKTGDIPVGCVILLNNKVIAKAHNQKEKDNISVNHAEILAIIKAHKKLKNVRLTNCDIYVTMEPCTMCLSAIAQSGINTLYYGVKNPQFGGITNSINLLEEFKFPNKVKIYGKILEKECFDIVKNFFKLLRK